VPSMPWTPVVVDQPCMYLGSWSASAQRFLLSVGGKVSQDLLVVWTTSTETHVGDDIFLAADMKHYHVREAQVEGGLTRLLCDSAMAQNTSP
jgi:hypothetical protein